MRLTKKISRDNIYEEFILSYKDPSVFSKNISFKFKDEEAVGYDVTRDAFPASFVETYNKFEGNSARIPLTTMELKQHTRLYYAWCFSCLIRTPCFCMQKLYSGMGTFWRDVSKNMFLSLFESLSLTLSSV